jgi:hypothetical protein
MRREELRELLIAVGLDLLIEEGPARGTERLTFKRVFDRAADAHGVRVTNASVIGRIWSDMDDFQADVLSAALEQLDRGGAEETLRAAIEVLDAADLDSINGRKTAATEVIRVACAAHIEALTRSRTSTVIMGLRGQSASKISMAVGAPSGDSVQQAYEVYSKRWDYVLEHAFDVLGIRVRAGLTIRQLSMLAISLAEGFTIWDRVDPTMTRHILRPTGQHGEKQEWSLFSLGVEGLIWQFAEFAEDGAAHLQVGGEASAGVPG